MTEAEWLACTDPTPMLEFLSGRVSDRKARFFACACCRQIWPILTDENSRRAVEVAELFADRLVSDKQRALARNQPGVWAVAKLTVARNGRFLHTAMSCAWHARTTAASETSQLHRHDPSAYWEVVAAEGVAQSKLIRDLFGNPFRPVTLDPTWLAWNHGTVLQLAQSIYDERAFDQLPILADALEEAGCRDAAILDHCRQPGLHARGCWLLDLLLQRS